VSPLVKFMTDEKKVKSGSCSARLRLRARVDRAGQKTIKELGGTILGEEYQPPSVDGRRSSRSARQAGWHHAPPGRRLNIDFMKTAAGLTMPVGSLSSTTDGRAGRRAAEGALLHGDYFTGTTTRTRPSSRR
jgi:hypothetical protein